MEPCYVFHFGETYSDSLAGGLGSQWWIEQVHLPLGKQEERISEVLLSAEPPRPFFETGSFHVIEASLKCVAMCFTLLSARITGVPYHV